MRKAMRRAVATAGVAVTAGALPLVMALPANASQARCVNYLGINGYVVGPKVKYACAQGAKGEWEVCVLQLDKIGVNRRHAETACDDA